MKNINILIEKLEKLTNKKVILEDDEIVYSKYIKPIKLDERLAKKKIEFDKNITINGNELTYNSDINGLVELLILEKFYKDYIINVKGHVNISNCNLKTIPIQFGKVSGRFFFIIIN